MPELMPWEFDARYSQCGQRFFTIKALENHEKKCAYCIRQNARNK